MALLVIPASANAKTELHYFERNVSFTFTHENGQPLGLDAAPRAGDRFVSVDALYTGTHSSHGDKLIGHARLSCVLTSGDRALCNGKVELPGGTLLAKHVIVGLASTSIKVEINGGRREFEGANGYVRAVSVTDSTSDVTIVVL
jgi:hypothetical protein